METFKKVLGIQCSVCDAMLFYGTDISAHTLSFHDLNDAPLIVVADINEKGKRGELVCGRCNTQLELEVKFTAKVREKKDDEVNDGWRVT